MRLLAEEMVHDRALLQRRGELEGVSCLGRQLLVGRRLWQLGLIAVDGRDTAAADASALADAPGLRRVDGRFEILINDGEHLSSLLVDQGVQVQDNTSSFISLPKQAQVAVLEI